MNNPQRIERLEQMLKENSADPFLLHALALEKVKIGDDVAAKDLFRKVVTGTPDYVGTYYHLAKLLERNGETDAALQVYEQGMEVARKLKDNHAWSELRSAYEELSF